MATQACVVVNVSQVTVDIDTSLIDMNPQQAVSEFWTVWQVFETAAGRYSVVGGLNIPPTALAPPGWGVTIW